MSKEKIISLIEEDKFVKSHSLAFKEILKYKENEK